MKQNEPISKIMSADVKTIQVGQKISDARRLLADGRFQHIPILDGKKLVGMLSSADLMKLTFDWGNSDVRSMDAVLDNQFTVKDTMTTEPTTMPATATVRDAAEMLSKGDFHALPIVDAEHVLTGIVTSSDLIRYLLDQY